jgi:type II secretory pathway pseudopilin PulG
MKTDDRGETLVESLISMILLGIIGLAVFSAMTLSVKTSGIYKNRAQSSVALRKWAEQVSAYPTYTNCVTSGTWVANHPVSSTYVPPTGGSVVLVKYWSAATSTFVSTPCSTDQGVQLVTLQVVTAGTTVTSATQQVDVAVRRP